MKPIAVNKTNTKKIFRWCKDHYGLSKFNSQKSLKLIFDDKLLDNDGNFLAFGEYCPKLNGITINLKTHKEHSILTLIDTMIHEYTHFKQDIKVMYGKYVHEYSYNFQNHPYEITARDRAAKDRWLCYRELFGVESI